MAVNNDMLLYSLSKTFESLEIKICADTHKFQKKTGKLFRDLAADEKLYYNKYAMELTSSLIKHVGNVNLFEVNSDQNDNDCSHNFRLSIDDGKTYHYISMTRTKNNDLIPDKLIKICGYKKTTDISKAFFEEYENICKKGYQKVMKYEKYYEVPSDVKSKYIFTPIRDATYDVLHTNSETCAKKIYSHLFSQEKKIVLKILKTRFVIYDFGKRLKNIKNFDIEKNDQGKLDITFNNGAKFSLALSTNSADIKEHLSLKYHSKFQNMDDLYAVAKSSI